MTSRAADSADAPNREIRVFLSSTFRDMDPERDYLLQRVFPKFRQDCAQRSVGFTEIDLRWGVTEEASKNGSTVDICLSEIDRCREYPPFFIGFLGERYGWIPRPQDLAQYWDLHADSPYVERIRASLAEGIGVTELEMRFGVLDHLHAPTFANAHFFLRHADLTASYFHAAGTVAESDFYDDGGGRLNGFKQRLRDSGLLDLDGYRSVEAFGERIYRILLEGLEARYPADLVPDAVAQRAQLHARFAASRRQGYVPLPAMRQRIGAALAKRLAPEREAQEPIYVTAPSGAGKSALMADLAQWLPSEFPGAIVHARYSGADGSREIGLWRDDLLAQWQGDVADAHAVAQDRLDSPDDAARWNLLVAAVAEAQRRHAAPILLLIDAIDRLDAPAEALHALAAQYWPPGVAVIVTGLPAYSPAFGCETLTLDRPAPAQRMQMIDAFTANYRKALSAPLSALLAHHPCTEVPLYLRMLLEELRVHSHHETLPADIASLLDFSAPDALFAHQLRRWDMDYGDAVHPRPASDLAALLALSRDGLDETELADLLARPADPHSMETGRPRMPAAKLSPLLAVLRPYLLRNEGKESLMHMALQRGAWPSVADAEVMRQSMAAYFDRPTPRAMAECLHQRLQLALADTAGRGYAAALRACVLPLAHVLMLRGKDAPLVRDALQLLRANRPDAGVGMAVVGAAWARQVDALCASTASREACGQLLKDVNFWGGSLRKWAYFSEQLPLAEAMLAAARRNWPDGNAFVVLSAHNLSVSYGDMGQQDNAVLLLSEAMTAAQADPSTSMLEMSLLMSSLGNLYRRKQWFDKARACFEQVLKLYRAVLPPKHRALSDTLNDLAVCCSESGDLEQSAVYLEEALEIDRAALSAGHPDTGAVLANIGMTYCERGDFSRAEDYLLQALSIARAALPAQHPSIVKALSNLSVLYRTFDRLEEAAAYAGEALVMARLLVSNGDSGLCESLGNLASIFEAQGKSQEAEALHIEALSIVPAEDLRRAVFLSNLALLYERRAPALWDKAASLFAQSLAIRRALLPASHPLIARSLRSLGMLHVKQGRPEKAAGCFREALSILQAAPAPDAGAIGRMLTLLANSDGLPQATSFTSAASVSYAGGYAGAYSISYSIGDRRRRRSNGES